MLLCALGGELRRNPFLFDTRSVFHFGITLYCALSLQACTSDNAQIASSEDEAHVHGGTSITIWTDATELFFEHPPIIAREAGEPWAIHVTRLEDFSPLTEGILTLAFRAPDGTVFTIKSEAPSKPGIYTPAPQLPAPGAYDLVIDIRGPMLTDRIDVGEIQVYRNEEEIPHQAAANDAIAFLKEQQWPISFTTTTTSRRDIPVTIDVSGEIIPAAGRVAEVASPVSGLALAQVNMDAPAPGDRIRKGEVMVALAPTSQDDSYARAKADVERLGRAYDRLQRLFDAEAIPERRLIEARHDLEIARSALDAMGATTEDGYSYPVRAPLTGVIQERFFTPGARIEIGQPLYSIVDPHLVWLRLHLPASNASLSGSFRSSHFTVEGSDRVYRTERVVSVGSTIDPSSRTFPVLLAVENSDESLKIGLIAQAHLQMSDQRSGLAIPNSAIMMEDGLPVAYVQLGGESFERRLLTLGPSDGTYTHVEQGVSEDDHVVTEGAYQVYLASLNTNAIGDHGHPH